MVEKRSPIPLRSQSKLLLLVVISFAILSLFLQERAITKVNLNGSNIANDQPTQTTTLHQRKPKLADGCYHVFLDVGANIGIHSRFLYEPDLYPNSKTSVATLAREFGYPRDNRDYCSFSFEPNPKFEQRHLDLQQAYEAMGWRYTPIFAGAANSDGNFTFYHSAFGKEPWETGFSATAKKTLYGDDAEARVVPIVRLASWIRNEVEGRLLPQPHSKDGSNQPKVVMKLDIEGLEYKVFPDLLTTGALCNNIHFLMGEFHHKRGNHNYYPMNITEDGKHVLKDRGEGRAFADEMLRLVDATDSCRTRYSLDDDESYITDPHPLPSPMNQTAR